MSWRASILLKQTQHVSNPNGSVCINVFSPSQFNSLAGLSFAADDNHSKNNNRKPGHHHYNPRNNNIGHPTSTIPDTVSHDRSVTAETATTISLTRPSKPTAASVLVRVFLIFSFYIYRDTFIPLVYVYDPHLNSPTTLWRQLERCRCRCHL